MRWPFVRYRAELPRVNDLLLLDSPSATTANVVEVVEHGGGEDAIEPVDTRDLVPLVLVATPARDLDDDLDALGELAITRYRGAPR